MPKTPECPECGAELPVDFPQALCPKCLLRHRLNSGSTGAQTQPATVSPSLNCFQVRRSPFPGPARNHHRFWRAGGSFAVLLISLLLAQPAAVSGATGCQAAIDLVFVLDGSGSITSDDFIKMKEFAARVVNQFNVTQGGAHIGVVQFSEKVLFGPPAAQTEIELTDNLPAVVRTITNMVQRQGGTDTAAGLRQGQAELAKGRPNVMDVLILLTDGKANDTTEARNAAAQIRAAGAQIFVIGVRDTTGQNINIDEKYVRFIRIARNDF